MLQRSKEWHEARLGRFTSSRINELMGIKGLNKTGHSYAFDKAVEKVFGKDESDNYISFDMQRGIDLEPHAFKKFKELKSLEFIDVSECSFFELGENSGSSPDGIVGLKDILEIKCPGHKKFFSYLKDGVKAIDPKYIDQMQHQMLCTGGEKAHFFNYIIFNGEEMWHEIIINRDEKRIELIKERIEEATEIRDEYVKELINNKQF